MTIIKLNNITKNYNGKTLLDKIDFEFNGDNIYIIRGESGSGKTTLLNIIAGYINTDDGIVEVDPSIKIGYLFQDEMLFSNLSVKENMFIKFCLVHNEYN